ncbi:MAG: SsrA-binding protein SmpB [Clostridiales bacterium]|jgi:SsrA-binding protein|nr:SsrA-binding protein SmpB [Clostridiales bacterium]
MKIITDNRRAYFEYHILDTFQAGICLKGSEVKSAMNGHMSLSDGFCRIEKREIYLKNAYIKPYDKGSHFNSLDRRDRKLLLHRSEINKISSKLRDSGITIIPLKAYFLKGKIKIDIAIVKGKKLHDKKQSIKERDIIRSVEREWK